MTQRQRLVVACGVQVKPTNDPSAFTNRVAEWLEGNKWAGEAFDKHGWSFARFVRDCRKVSKQQHA